MKTETEKTKIAESFLEDLKRLIKKYDAKDVSICCQLENKYFGIIGMNSKDYGDFFNAVLYIARLYQSAKEKVSNVLNEFEERK